MHSDTTAGFCRLHLFPASLETSECSGGHRMLKSFNHLNSIFQMPEYQAIKSISQSNSSENTVLPMLKTRP